MARPKTYRGEPVRSYRYRRLESEFFSPAECDFYSERAISGRNVRWLRRARMKWFGRLTPAQRKGFMSQIEDYYRERVKAEAEMGEKIYSPRLYEDRVAMVELWEEALSGFAIRRSVK